jgi:hypothetical protein
MVGCGKQDNNGKVVTGAPLTCGTRLYWKTDSTRPQDRTLEVILCDECKKLKEESQ